MNNALRTMAVSLGVLAGLAGLEHGYFETLQGNVPPNSLMIYSMGSPCEPNRIWNACEPALTIIPSFFVAGVLTIVMGVVVLLWSAAFLHDKRGGQSLVLLCLPLLLLGGGVFPPVIGLIGGLVATQINASPAGWRIRFPGNSGHFLAGLWPWSLFIFLAWMLAGQWIVGYFLNDFMLRNGWLVPLLVLGLLAVAVLTAFARRGQPEYVSHQRLAATG